MTIYFLLALSLAASFAVAHGRTYWKLLDARAELEVLRERYRKLFGAKAKELGIPVKGDPFCPRDAIYIMNAEYVPKDGDS
jgi:hypothetical protein